jgi:MFS transporter, ACS family, hexuronate transporter
LDIKAIGAAAWIPYAAAGLGSMAGGSLSSYLIRRDFSVNASRKIPLTIAAALMPSALLVSGAPLELALFLFSLAFLGHQFWSTIVQTLPADMFPSHCVGRVAGLLGAAGSFGGMLFNLLVGWWLTQTHSYAAVMIAAGLLHPLSLLVILVAIPRIERVRVGEKA